MKFIPMWKWLLAVESGHESFKGDRFRKMLPRERFLDLEFLDLEEKTSRVPRWYAQQKNFGVAIATLFRH